MTAEPGGEEKLRTGRVMAPKPVKSGERKQGETEWGATTPQKMFFFSERLVTQ